MKENDRADRLAGKMITTSGLCLGRPEVLRSLRHHQWAQNQGHHSTDRLDERSVTFELFHEQHCGQISERQGGMHMGLPERVDLV